MSKILCCVTTKGRYHTTLPLALLAVANQTMKFDKLVVFDDNDEPEDIRKILSYSYILQILEQRGIEWEWVYALKKGQHFSHQAANSMNFDWVWRVDDDAIPEPNVLENLWQWVDDTVGAVGGSVLTPPYMPDTSDVTGEIDNINDEPNAQWGKINAVKYVEHLHCTFLYRAGVADYNLGLSKVAHREETLFTYALFKKGYKLLVVPNAVTWHMKNPEGGIRSQNNMELYVHDEQIFKNFMQYRDNTIVVLNSGFGDHIVFNSILPSIKNPVVFSCYPEVTPGKPLKEAIELFGDLEQWSIYKKMAQWGWKDSLQNAFRKMYL